VLSREVDDPVPALGRAHDPSDGGEVLRGEIPGGHAVGGDHEILDDLRGAVLVFGFESADVVALKDRPRLDGLQAQRAVDVAQRLEALGDPILHAQVLRQAGHALNVLGDGAAPVQPGGDAAIGELGVIADACPIDVRVLYGAPASTTNSTTTASRSSSRFSEVRSVESFSGSIGKISAAVYTEVVLWRACPSMAEPSFTSASTSATATRILTMGPGSVSATVS